MKLFLCTRLTASTALTIALAGAGLGTAVVPAAASAKKPAKVSTGLTKSQVIGLIKKYSKPGPAGRMGAQGTPGIQGIQGIQGDVGPDWTVATNSGLSLTGDALGLNPGLIGQCANNEDVFGLNANSFRCDYPVNMAHDSEGYSGPTLAAPSATSTVTIGGLNLMSADEIGAVGASYYVNSSMEFKATASTSVTCAIIDPASVTVQTDAVTTIAGGYVDLDIQAILGNQPGGTVDTFCNAPNAGGVTGQGTMGAFPLG